MTSDNQNMLLTTNVAIASLCAKVEKLQQSFEIQLSTMSSFSKRIERLELQETHENSVLWAENLLSCDDVEDVVLPDYRNSDSASAEATSMVGGGLSSASTLLTRFSPSSEIWIDDDGSDTANRTIRSAAAIIQQDDNDSHALRQTPSQSPNAWTMLAINDPTTNTFISDHPDICSTGTASDNVLTEVFDNANSNHCSAALIDELNSVVDCSIDNQTLVSMTTTTTSVVVPTNELSPNKPNIKAFVDEPPIREELIRGSEGAMVSVVATPIIESLHTTDTNSSTATAFCSSTAAKGITTAASSPTSATTTAAIYPPPMGLESSIKRMAQLLKMPSQHVVSLHDSSSTAKVSVQHERRAQQSPVQQQAEMHPSPAVPPIVIASDASAIIAATEKKGLCVDAAAPLTATPATAINITTDSSPNSSAIKRGGVRYRSAEAIIAATVDRNNVLSSSHRNSSYHCTAAAVTTAQSMDATQGSSNNSTAFSTASITAAEPFQTTTPKLIPSSSYYAKSTAAAFRTPVKPLTNNAAVGNIATSMSNGNTHRISSDAEGSHSLPPDLNVTYHCTIRPPNAATPPSELVSTDKITADRDRPGNHYRVIQPAAAPPPQKHAADSAEKRNPSLISAALYMLNKQKYISQEQDQQKYTSQHDNGDVHKCSRHRISRDGGSGIKQHVPHGLKSSSSITTTRAANNNEFTNITAAGNKDETAMNISSGRVVAVVRMEPEGLLPAEVLVTTPITRAPPPTPSKAGGNRSTIGNPLLRGSSSTTTSIGTDTVHGDATVASPSPPPMLRVPTHPTAATTNIPISVSISGATCTPSAISIPIVTNNRPSSPKANNIPSSITSTVSATATVAPSATFTTTNTTGFGTGTESV